MRKTLSDVLTAIEIRGEYKYVRKVSFDRLTYILTQLWGALEESYAKDRVAKVIYRDKRRIIGNPVRTLTVLNWDSTWGIDYYEAGEIQYRFPEKSTVLKVKIIPANTGGVLETKLITKPEIDKPLMESIRPKGLPEV